MLKPILSVLVAGTLFYTSIATAGSLPQTPVAMVKQAFSDMHLAYHEHESVNQNPHFVIDDDELGIPLAVYFADCNEARNACEDIIFYADFGRRGGARINHELEEIIREWNHISALYRTTAFRSDGGEVGLDLTMSFVDNIEVVRFNIGAFLYEVGVMEGLIGRGN
tara:strand:- start:233 stop:730 length:498 start_codon:yes stop_codon:yes gene_type:complete